MRVAPHRRSKGAQANPGPESLRFRDRGGSGRRTASGRPVGPERGGLAWPSRFSPADPPPPKSSPLAALARGARRPHGAVRGLDAADPVPAGILAEHAACRASAALFDVSHMGQVTLAGPPRRGAGAAGGRRPRGPAPGAPALHAVHQRGGRHPRRPDGAPISTAGCTWSSTPRARSTICVIFALHLPAGAEAILEPDRALLALQGPAAVTVLARLAPQVARDAVHGGGGGCARRRRRHRRALGLHRRGWVRDFVARP